LPHLNCQFKFHGLTSHGGNITNSMPDDPAMLATRQLVRYRSDSR
jgi:hypothetical protein